MELTRRDALAALAVAGGAGGALAVRDPDPREEGDPGGRVELEEGALATLVGLAEVLYPSDIEGIEPFVREYVAGRIAGREAYAAGVREAVSYLDAYCESWHDASFAELDPATREAVLRDMDADVADPVPEGSDLKRLRFYAINELLFALYASPTGGELVGIENPQGHPGGLASYRRGPQGTGDEG